MIHFNVKTYAVTTFMLIASSVIATRYFSSPIYSLGSLVIAGLMFWKMNKLATSSGELTLDYLKKLSELQKNQKEADLLMQAIENDTNDTRENRVRLKQLLKQNNILLNDI